MEEFGDTIEKCFARMDELSDTTETDYTGAGWGGVAAFQGQKRLGFQCNRKFVETCRSLDLLALLWTPSATRDGLG